MAFAKYTTGSIYNGSNATLTLDAANQNEITDVTPNDLLSDGLILQVENFSATTNTIVRIRVYSIVNETGDKVEVYDSQAQSLPLLTEKQFFFRFQSLEQGAKFEVVGTTNNAEFTQFSVWGVVLSEAVFSSVIGINTAHRILQAEMTLTV